MERPSHQLSARHRGRKWWSGVEIGHTLWLRNGFAPRPIAGPSPVHRDWPAASTKLGSLGDSGEVGLGESDGSEPTRLKTARCILDREVREGRQLT